MKTAFITGVAGFIGSNLADHLLQKGYRVVGYDNFSTGKKEFIQSAEKSADFNLITGDLLDIETLHNAMKNCDLVFHLAANADVRGGTHDPSRDLNQNTIVTFNVLEAMRHNNIKTIAFSSTGSIYGEPDVFPTPETYSFPIQTSLYGASKLAGEGLIQAYCEGFGFKGYIFRFVSVLGPRYTHGHVLDFIKKLRSNATTLEILGDGNQRKSYMHVEDCINAVVSRVESGAADNAKHRVEIYNLGTDEYCNVKDSAKLICEQLKVQPEFVYTGGERGWIGDSPFIFLDTKKIRSTGWRPKYSIRESVQKTAQWILDNAWVLKH